MAENYFSRRFKRGIFRYMTRATIEDGDVLIEQNERCDAPKLDIRNQVFLSISDFKKMIKELGLD